MKENKQKKILTAMTRMMSGNVLLTLLNLMRDLSIAAFFGATLLSDYYFLAIMFPVFFITVLAGAYRSSTIPFLEEKELGRDENTPQLISYLNASLIRSLAVLSILFIIFTWLVLGILGRAGDVVEGVTVVYLFMAVIPIYAVSAYIECNVGHMQYIRKFFFGGVLRLGLPIGTIIGCLLFADKFSIYALPMGGAVGIFVVIMILIERQRHEGFLPVFNRRLKASYTKRIVYAMGALSIGTSMSYINPIIDQLVAASLGEGSIALLGYSNRLAIGLSSITAGAIGPVLLVYYSNILGSGGKSELQDLFNKTFILCCWISCFLVVVVASYAIHIVDLVYTRGNMSTDDSLAVGRLVQYYSCQYIPLITSAAVYPLISALNLNKIFIPINLVLCIINLIADIILSEYFGLLGIAISTVMVYVVSLILMMVYLVRGGYVVVQLRTYANLFAAVMSAVLIYFSAIIVKEINGVEIFNINLMQASIIAGYGFFVMWLCKKSIKDLK